MEDEGEDDEGPIEVFGIHRLVLKPGSRSGYVGVRPNPSKKCPWQAWLQVGGQRKMVGNFKTRQEAAVARAAAKAAGAHLLRTARESGLRAIQVPFRDPIPIGITSLSPIHHRSCSHSHSHDLGQENVQRKRLSPLSRCPASTRRLLAYC